jgi:hypothetical protein
LIETTSTVAKTGDVFGRYTVLGLFKEPDAYPKFARVQCSCGSPPRYVLLYVLRRGEAQSCGCLHKERVTKHGAWGHPLFKVWRGMMERCTDPANKRFKDYGGRGIKVCERWRDVHAFIEDMTEGYSKGLQIDRIDNHGPYAPENCRWATAKQQTRNYRRNVVLEHDGKRLCVVDWAVEVGIDAKVLYDRVARGWNAKRVLTTPVMSNRESGRIAGHTRWHGVDDLI